MVELQKLPGKAIFCVRYGHIVIIVIYEINPELDWKWKCRKLKQRVMFVTSVIKPRIATRIGIDIFASERKPIWRAMTSTS